MSQQNAHPGLSPALTVLIAIATGLAVASNYYAQPLLETIATGFNLSVNQAGLSLPPRSSVTPPGCCCWCRSAICSSAAG